ncbi:MAG: hypothetical protein ACK5D5_06960 [Bacteroidota bacterium]|jgi:hypothetical protein
MKKAILAFYGVVFYSILFTGCNNSDKKINSENAISDSAANTNNADTLRTEKLVAEMPEEKEKTINVKFKTKLVEWGGDGKWHDMFKNDNGSYWVNYSDPFKIILTGNYSDLTVKVKSSAGATIFEKSGIGIPENGEYVVSNAKMMGENETSYTVEIISKDKSLFKGKIESVPGGE